MRTENMIESIYREFQTIDREFISLYKYFNNIKLQEIFSTIHSNIIEGFTDMNRRLPTGKNTAHFWAESSRLIIECIDKSERLCLGLKSSEYAFELDGYYKNVFEECKKFLKTSGGSEIPCNMNKVELYYKLPIFLLLDTVNIRLKNKIFNFDLKLIGEGSYAKVYKYKDKFYNRNFVIKRAKKDLNEKELERFNREYYEMKNFSSPYIVEVYRFDKEKKEYFMEYMDYTLESFIQNNNQKIDITIRKNIVNQILKAFRYIHTQKRLHRDISPKNILIKEYHDIMVVKISDFGLVKTPESTLTSIYTDVKGYFNDPNLEHVGFDNYNIKHEIYALTRIIYFVMTGRFTINNIEDEKLKRFVEIGMNTDLSIRYGSVDKMIIDFNKLF